MRILQLKAPKRFAAARVRSSPRGDFRQFIGDKLRKVPFGERAAHDARLLAARQSRNKSWIYFCALPSASGKIPGLRPVHILVRAAEGSRRSLLSAAAQ